MPAPLSSDLRQRFGALVLSGLTGAEAAHRLMVSPATGARKVRESPERLVFIDETSVKTNMTRPRGRARKGRRLHARAPAGLWNTQTFIAV